MVSPSSKWQYVISNFSHWCCCCLTFSSPVLSVAFVWSTVAAVRQQGQTDEDHLIHVTCRFLCSSFRVGILEHTHDNIWFFLLLCVSVCFWVKKCPANESLLTFSCFSSQSLKAVEQEADNSWVVASEEVEHIVAVADPIIMRKHISDGEQVLQSFCANFLSKSTIYPSHRLGCGLCRARYKCHD